jgi:hypothetical protein
MDKLKSFENNKTIFYYFLDGYLNIDSYYKSLIYLLIFVKKY